MGFAYHIAEHICHVTRSYLNSQCLLMHDDPRFYTEDVQFQVRFRLVGIMKH